MPSASGERQHWFHRFAASGTRLTLLLVVVAWLPGCRATAGASATALGTFPPLRHGVKAVFGPNGNDYGGDLEGRGRQLVQAFHDVGMDLTRIEFKWAIIEQERGTYDWSEMDRLIGFLHENGIEPMLMLYCAPVWAMRGTPADEQLFINRNEQNLHTVVWPRREFMPDFERFCETAARRYRGRARLFEFWNEPDGMAGPLVYHDKSGKAVDVRYGGDAKEYTLWLKHMYAAVKRGNPDAEVAAGSLCVHDTQFIEAMYAAGCQDFCDAISLHPYAGDGINVGWTEACRRVMTQYGDWIKPIWLSEFGWNLGGEYDATGEKWPASAFRQAEIITATAPVMQSLPYITHAFWFTLNDWNTSSTGIDPKGTHHYGVTDLQGRRRPGFEALRTIALKAPRSRRPAEMTLPQVMPPAGPIDADRHGSVHLTLACQDPSMRIAARPSGQSPHDRRFVLRTGDATLKQMQVPESARSARGTAGSPSAVMVDLDLSLGQKIDRAGRPGIWDAVASFGFGPETRFPLTLPASTPRADKAPRMDADFADWSGTWPIENGPMQAQIAWDATHLFLAVNVRDANHQQPHRGRDIWKGDCIQVAFDPQRDAVRGSRYDINDSEYALALTADGPQLWRFICPLGSYVGEVNAAAVAVRRVGDRTHYEAAIPWSEIGEVKPQAGRLIGMSIAACDWNGEERTVHRFGDGIIGAKEPYRFASIRLEDETSIALVRPSGVK